MNKIPDMYTQITLKDGRKGIVVDYMGDVILVDTVDEQNEWITVEVVMVGDEFHVCEDNGKVYNLCRRKEVRLQVSEDNVFCFLFGDKYEGEYFCLNEKQHNWLCDLLEVDTAEFVEGWSHHFEYNNFTSFLNAYRIITADNFYYAYGYDAEEKTADALYRFNQGHFERYFPMESVWREMPEQRMILQEKKPRYERVSDIEGMSLALLK